MRGTRIRWYWELPDIIPVVILVGVRRLGDVDGHIGTVNRTSVGTFEVPPIRGGTGVWGNHPEAQGVTVVISEEGLGGIR